MTLVPSMICKHLFELENLFTRLVDDLREVMMDIQPYTPHNPYNSRRAILKFPKRAMDSGHHRQAVVTTTTNGEGPVWTKTEPDFVLLIC